MSKVLLVDNETTRVAGIREALERGGFETVSAVNGNEALKTFLNEVPDLVLVGPLAADPDESFCQRMRETRPGNATPIVLYCEPLDGDALKAALERSGCNVYLEIPASDERVLEVCRHALVESVDSGTTNAPVMSVTAETPEFSSPDAAVAQLSASGKDIEDHLDSLFETGEAPPVQPWIADAGPSIETDMPELPPEPADYSLTDEPLAETAEATALESVEPEPIEPQFSIEPEQALPEPEQPLPVTSAAADTEPESDDTERELVGFQADDVAFDQPGEVDPGIQPEIAADAQSLVETPAEPAKPKFAVATPPVPWGEPAPVEVEHQEPDMPAFPAPQVAADEATLSEDAPPVDFPAESSRETGNSRGWLWGLVAAAALVGVALIFNLGPSLTSDEGQHEQTASLGPALPTATLLLGDGVVDPVDPEGTEITEITEGAEGAEGAEPAAVDPPVTAVVADPVIVEVADPGDVASAAASIEVTENAPTDPASTEVIETVTAIEDTPIEVAVAANPPRAAVPVAPKPAPSTETIFQPSTEIVDAATAGASFSPPQAIDRAQPIFDAADVPQGGITVVLRVLVNDWGKAVRVNIEQGRSGGPLVEAAVDAVLKTRYTPAQHEGREVRAYATETFVFE